MSTFNTNTYHNTKNTIIMEVISTKQEEKSPRLWLKALLIFGISVALLIPQVLITHLIDERQATRTEAQSEVSQSWSGTQHIAGPAIIIPNSNDSSYISIFPSDLKITGNLTTETLKRGIFNFSVYNVPLTITGEFDFPAKLASMNISHYVMEKAYLFISLSDLRGLTDNATLTWNGEKHTIETATGGSNNDIATGLTYAVNIQPILDGQKIRFTIQLPLKGSEGLYVAPVGNITNAELKSDWGSPSFQGNFLPTSRQVSDSGFTASWKVLAMNRNFGQVRTNSTCWDSLMEDCEFGVDLHIPVDQYQQTTRTVKYAFLVIVLTFAVVFFVEIRRNTFIHPIQYLLIGIALLLFYTLLLSFSEHIAFSCSYLIAAIMTIGLITAFMAAILKGNRKTAFIVGLSLSALYIFLYVLLQLETYALLVGSIGLFVILAVAMFATVKLRNER